ncbi:MAG: FkbM family methyltransferase [Bacteroidales bacterium]|jgi:FkbM family methyltransferase|nr:FkbM family methyltransferase [Bacteroidales bacterium]
MSRISITRPFRKLAKRVSNRVSGRGIINYRDRGSINFIDVGSSGHLPEPWLSNACHIRKLLSFEPLGTGKANNNIIVSPNALWSCTTIRPFHVYKGFRSTGSSLFEQNFDFVNSNFESLRMTGPGHLASTWHERSALVKTEQIECTTLDATLRQLDLPFTFDFMKIDAQGAEYEILIGAEKFLTESCCGLHLELFTFPLYKGIKLLPEVTGLLEKMGFTLVLKYPPHGTFNSQNDCVFIKTAGSGVNKEKTDLIMKIYGL